jgi:hypothetical protein
MDIAKLYESIILRDILEYLTPGSIILFSICLITEATLRVLGINFSIFNAIIGSQFLGTVVLVAIAYSFGQLLTGLDYIFFRGKEISQANDVLAKDSWLRSKIVIVVSQYMEVSEQEAEKIIDDIESASTLRELTRSIIFSRSQSLYRDFVNRHSILSRFCKNMALALTFSLFSILISVVFSWKEVSAIFQKSPLVVSIWLMLIIGLIVYSIKVFTNRSNKLRRVMTKHTFQILYADFVNSKLNDKLKKDVKES